MQLTSPATIAVVALALTSGLVRIGSFPRRPSPVTPALPAILGSWQGMPLAVTDDVRAMLETDDVSLMEYQQADAPPVWVARVAGFGNRAAFHPPELCYVGSHFEVLERGRLTVTIGGTPRQVMRLVIGRGAERLEAWYWFTANARMTPNYYQQQLWLVMDAMRRAPVAGTLVRLSTPLDDPANAHDRLAAFLEGWTDAQLQPPAS